MPEKKNEFNSEALQEMAVKEQEKQNQYKTRLFCCASTACLASGSAPVQDTIKQAIKVNKLGKEVQLVPTGCMGLCSHGPMVRVQADDHATDILYKEVTPEIAQQVVDAHLLEEASAKKDTPPVSVEKQPVKELENDVLAQDIPFFIRQTKVVLANAGLVNPENLGDYVATGGYRALAKVLETMTPEQVCEEISRSGLRGRGGGGFPTGIKWNLLRKTPGDTKYIVANGDEGDPGAYMDRTIMEADPHRILEGMAIAGYATGARRGYLYVRGEYPIAVQRLEKAIRMATRKGILGKSVMGSDFSFEAEIRIGAGAFVCGEETALMYSIEGNRGMPRMRPPYPTQSGLWGHPTLINNVETLANIAPIIQNGADWFAGIGTEKSKGTKVFALTGDLKNTGLIEVPMGITLREIIEEMGGGMPDKYKFKAAQTGGPSGGCIPASHLDTPIDYESLQALGSIMGSGGLVVMDDKNLMPKVAKYFMEFCVDESCGKCVPCRVGTVKIQRLLEKIIDGKATHADLDKLKSLCEMVKTSSLCGLGQTAPNPVLSTLRYFPEEYESLLIQPEAVNEA
jgi:bidirectional [NiFe] hydrogenase diaphorase subunit